MVAISELPWLGTPAQHLALLAVGKTAQLSLLHPSLWPLSCTPTAGDFITTLIIAPFRMLDGIFLFKQSKLLSSLPAFTRSQLSLTAVLWNVFSIGLHPSEDVAPPLPPHSSRGPSSTEEGATYHLHSSLQGFFFSLSIGQLDSEVL